MSRKVAIVMGSDSDLPHLEPAVETLKRLEVPCEVRVLSAHRTPEEAGEFARTAAERGFGVIIAAAGGAAHLAGAMAAHSLLPIIGVPISATPLNG
ncbi:MAG: AIR carboxylase family protein, partial [Planctomycetota bacterium JB042]